MTKENVGKCGHPKCAGGNGELCYYKGRPMREYQKEEIQETGKYNGWSNRSTWLVNLHMTNTSEELNEFYRSAAVSANTEKQFKSRVLFLMPHAPLLNDEEQFFINEINWGELWDANRLTN